MKRSNFNMIYILLTLWMFSACEVVDPLSEEQYQKDIYLIGAYNRVAAFDVPYGNNQETFVSISASGTKKVDQDVNVTLTHKDELITQYNNKYMLDAPVKYRQLDESLMDIPSFSATLKAGDIYTRLPFTVNTLGLHCDSLYAISFAIESVSQYQKAESGTELIFKLNLVNQFSGAYHLDATKVTLREDVLAGGGTEWVEQGLPQPVKLQRTLTAVNMNEVRFFHEKTKETLTEYNASWDPGKDYFEAIKNFCVKFVQVNDSYHFTVEPWDSMQIMGGEAEYNEESGIFSFWYDYIDGADRKRMKGIFRK